MIRSSGFLVAIALLAACGGEPEDDDVRASTTDLGAAPEDIGAPGPGPIDTSCLVFQPANPPPAAGDLDVYFGCKGYATVADPIADLDVRAIAVQPDDKIIAVGESYSHQSNHHTVWVARFTAVGKLDTTFATKGIFTKSFTSLGGPDSAESVVVQANGGIVIAGGRRNENDADGAPSAFLFRLLPAGTLDPSFGSAGVVLTTAMTYGRSLKLQADGSLVVAGDKCTYPGGSCSGAVGRFSADGVADPSFGSGGVKTSNLGGAAPSSLSAAVTTGSDVIAVGTTKVGVVTDVGLARYGASALVPTFGTAGTKFYDMFPNALDESGTAIAALGTEFVFADSFTVAGKSFGVLGRMKADGSLNGYFGFYGVFATNFSEYGSTPNDLAVTSSAKIVVVGTAKTSTGHSRIAVERINALGGVDNTFSDDGVLLLSASAYDASASSVAFQSSGAIIVGGWKQSWGSATPNKRAVVARVRSH